MGTRALRIDAPPASVDNGAQRARAAMISVLRPAAVYSRDAIETLPGAKLAAPSEACRHAARTRESRGRVDKAVVIAGMPPASTPQPRFLGSLL